ncbi:MAG: ATP-binding protein [Anaerolineae bacterium]|nr:ATP-binding protein [Anaerolineae bacterium]
MRSANEILSGNYNGKSRPNMTISSSAEAGGHDGGRHDDGGIGRPDCPHCAGLGYVVPDLEPGEPGFGRAVPCVCRADEQARARLDVLMNMSQLGPLAHCTFESFIPEGHGLTPARRRNLQLAFDRARDYAARPEGWMVLKGGYGCGKTHLAAAIGNRQLAEGRPVLFINTPDLLDHLRATFSPESTVSYDERFDQVRNSPLLILDDLGTQSNSEWAQEKLYQILNHRYNSRLPTIITTNLELEAIEIRMRSRIVDPSLTQIVHITAPDFRRSGGDDQSDLSTLNFHADKTFETFDLRENELPRAQADNLHRALQQAVAFAEQPSGWLVFNSVAYGNGKTHLAAAIANYISNSGEPVLFIVVPDLLDHLRASFGPNSQTRLDKRFDEVKTAPLLVLDDLGTESATAWAREKLYQLFNYRYNAKLPTVITTAVPIEQLDPRLASRMLDGIRCTFFVLEAPSYRGKGSRQRRSGTRRG